MIAGFLPFEDPNTSQLYKKIIAGEYRVPRFLSTDARECLEKILDTNPETRFGIPELRMTKWCLQSNINHDPGIIVGTNLIPINEETLSRTAEHGIAPEYCRKCLDGNKHNGSTTTYYLLCTVYCMLFAVGCVLWYAVTVRLMLMVQRVVCYQRNCVTKACTV